MQDHNSTPRFAAALTESRRADESRAAQSAAIAAEQETTRARLAAAAVERLEHLVRPLLDQARIEIEADGNGALVGTGRNRLGDLLATLRILTGQAFEPELVFTATHEGARPFLGHHSEFYARKTEYLPSEIPKVTEATITAIIAAFLATPKLPPPSAGHERQA